MRKRLEELTDLELRHLGGEPLEDGGLAPPVVVDPHHEEPQVAPRVEARDDEHRPRAADQSEVSILCPPITAHLETLASMMPETTSITSSENTWSRPPSKPGSHLTSEGG